MIDAICKEMQRQKDYLNGQKISSIYLGGGTPSILTPNELNQLFNQLNQSFNIDEAQEVTLEANPDDMNEEMLNFLKQDSPVNRLSIGIQSFMEEELKYMNRAHNADEALRCVEMARKYDFQALSADLIYGSPVSTMESWKRNLQLLADLDIPHLSCYCLTVEEKTALAYQIKKGISKAPLEKDAADQFEYMIDFFKEHDYIQYEISNIAKEGHFAVHNSNYWRGVAYLGLGPGAHSFNGQERQWNMANNALYIKNIENSIQYFETEQLQPADRYNEYVMTGLRTIWGVEKSNLKQFGPEFNNYFNKVVSTFLKSGDIIENQEAFILSEAARLRADAIASDLFYI